MPEQYIGEIRIFGGNFAPKDWTLCEGQFLSVDEFPELFAVIGTVYGGNGVSNFALPDLRGRVPLGQGGHYLLGKRDGHETVSLHEGQVPSHTHSTMTALAQGATATGTGEGYVKCVTSGETTNNPKGRLPGKPAGSKRVYSSTAPETHMAGQSVQPDNGDMTIDFDVTVVNESFGNSYPHSNMQPFGCISYIIALKGIFPPRP